MPTKKQSTLTMDELLEQMPPETLEPGEVVEAKVITANRREVWLDLGVHGAGLVARREIDPAHTLKVGDKVSASVVESESEFGFPILSLRKIAKEKGWERLEKIYENDEIVAIYPYDANRGGLLVELEGIRGFLPVSQLTAEHYPRVAGADKEEILQRLNSLVRRPLKVRILDIDKEQAKLIVSEKEAAKEDTRQKLKEIKVGDKVDGVVTGSVDFGIFVTVEGIEGLVHISELAWERVNDPQELYKIGDKVTAKVIAIEEEKLSLSIKQLSADPWLGDVKKLKTSQVVEGKITRITPFGAFVQLTPAVEALVHIAEIEKDKSAKSTAGLEVGKSREFKITEIDPESRKISLTTKLTAEKAKKPAVAKTKPSSKK